MNYWLLIVMMLVAVLAVTAVLADDDHPAVASTPDVFKDREEPIEHGDL